MRSNAPHTQREAVNDLADAAGVSRVKVGQLPAIALSALGLFMPLIRELGETMYQFEAPFILDDSETRTTFNVVPTPWNDILTAQIVAYR